MAFFHSKSKLKPQQSKHSKQPINYMMILINLIERLNDNYRLDESKFS